MSTPAMPIRQREAEKVYFDTATTPTNTHAQRVAHRRARAVTYLMKRVAGKAQRLDKWAVRGGCPDRLGAKALQVVDLETRLKQAPMRMLLGNWSTAVPR